MSSFEATRGVIWDVRRNFEARSDDEDNTLAIAPSPNFHTTPDEEFLPPYAEINVQHAYGGYSEEFRFRNRNPPAPRLSHRGPRSIQEESTVLPPREKLQTPDLLVAVVMETGYSTAFWGEGKGFISFGADKTDGSLVSFCTTVENEFLA
ncbi:hypothetical protein AVEN_225904-1 [Araneus ventricosus]|uniref:Uncharacterized protein n=1 Tax=Araneus ventricosus TaxID=182803 RepID=A0A4Y2BAN0_ARAVE|nr:hypothetical protein AVEN_225904-1 [Araneus ventricosus]